MIWAILWTFLNSLSSIFRKKSMLLTDLKWQMYQIFWYFFWWLLVTLWIIVFWDLDFSKITLISILIFIIVKASANISNTIEQEIYKKEKFSTLIPFENFQKIFIVTLSFFLFSDTKIETLLITIASIFFVLLFNIDFKDFKLPKYTKQIIGINLIFAIEYLTIWYLLKIINFETYFTFNYIVWWIIVILFLLIKKEDFKLIFKQKKEFYIYRWFWSIIWNIWWLISMYLISSLWVVVSMLLWFLAVWMRLIFAYFILKEIPTKKEIYLVLILFVFIWIWYYFK